MPCRVSMALDPKQLSKLLQLRALGWSQQEIADAIGVSRQVIGYQLKKLKKESQEKGTEEVFRTGCRWTSIGCCCWNWNICLTK